MSLPDVYYGKALSQPKDWREAADTFDADDDDEELASTPKSVVNMLGFDPLDTKPCE